MTAKQLAAVSLGLSDRRVISEKTNRVNAPDLHRYQREALKDAAWGLSRDCVRLRGGGDNHRAAAKPTGKT
jgi:hypothetical protein